MTETLIKELLATYGLGVSGWIMFVLALLEIRRCYRDRLADKQNAIEKLAAANERLASNTDSLRVLTAFVGDYRQQGRVRAADLLEDQRR